jgi:hypothetical protein
VRDLKSACSADYTQNRACFRLGEVRIFDPIGGVERVIPFDDANRKMCAHDRTHEHKGDFKEP